MTPDEARKLLGGYATGSLSEAERTALFEAALEDQELFDELAGEQMLKEVLDEPGARERVLTALEPPRRHRLWLWATAAASLAVALVIGIVVGTLMNSRTPPPPQQIAQVTKSPEPVAPPVVPEPARAPAPPPVRQKVPPVPAPEAAPAPASPPPAELKKEEALADQLQRAKPQASEDAARGFVAGAPAAAALRAQNQVVSVSAFAFNYAVRADGFLQIVPMSPGFLAVTANGADIFPSGAVSAGTPVRIPIPPDAASLTIVFSRMPGAIGTPVRRDETAGTVTDQDPPNGRIMVELSLTPATR
jgi:hypothetical protein